MATNNQILSKVRLIERLMGIKKPIEYTIRTRSGKYAVFTPTKQLTKFETRSNLYNVLDAYVKGMEDFKNRVKIKRTYKGKG